MVVGANGFTPRRMLPAFTARPTRRLQVCDAHVQSRITFISLGLGRVLATPGAWRWPHADAGLNRELQPRLVRAPARDEGLLDFRALSGKTARTVSRDGREQGPAVHSVRSWTDETNGRTINQGFR